ncbi:hypothetical protein Moror_7918 [Moniliophthora roreri MCA 2997]|uniref:Uncharacterized protein n=1 Tax=Moniliophthora roreri (strain MCA 2997) TaxID=1381753 RepID=V2WT41_MONRO|nr:hypothetical protein Moror_7918 [Moniliophthora roreri MCA 2997]
MHYCSAFLPWRRCIAGAPLSLGIIMSEFSVQVWGPPPARSLTLRASFTRRSQAPNHRLASTYTPDRLTQSLSPSELQSYTVLFRGLCSRVFFTATASERRYGLGSMNSGKYASRQDSSSRVDVLNLSRVTLNASRHPTGPESVPHNRPRVSEPTSTF